VSPGISVPPPCRPEPSETRPYSSQGFNPQKIRLCGPRPRSGESHSPEGRTACPEHVDGAFAPDRLIPKNEIVTTPTFAQPSQDFNGTGPYPSNTKERGYQPGWPFQCSFPSAPNMPERTELGSITDGQDKWHGIGSAGFSPAGADFLAAPHKTDAVPS